MSILKGDATTYTLPFVAQIVKACVCICGRVRVSASQDARSEGFAKYLTLPKWCIIC